MSRMTVSRHDLETLLARLERDTADPRAGLFGPGSKVWEIARESAVFLGGGRAALLQTAHPFVAHAVDQHSATKTDPVGRFRRTFDNVFAMIFGDLDVAITSARRVHGVHRRIQGAVDEDVGRFHRGAPYAANLEEGLVWVAATLWDTAVQCFELVVRPLSTWEKDQYLEESKRFAYLFGLGDDQLFSSWADFQRYVDDVYASGTLGVGRPAKELRRFLFRPPHPLLALPSSVYTTVTGQLLPKPLRDAYGFSDGALDRATTKATLASIRLAYHALPKTVRYLPAYRAAMERAGQGPQGAVSRKLDEIYQALTHPDARRAPAR